MDFTTFIKAELLILVPVLYLVGNAIKKSDIADKYIPFLLGAISVVLSCIYVFATDNIVGIKTVLTATFTAITQGILCAGASVYTNQLIKQATKEE